MEQYADNYYKVKQSLPECVTLVVVSKARSIKAIEELYHCGNRIFGENKVQELVDKHAYLPSDIQWHMIGHLQRNKVKYIAPFIDLIHSVDSFRLLTEINKQAQKNNRIISCLLQVKVADEKTKFGFEITKVLEFIESEELKSLNNVRIEGLMAMATNTNDQDKILAEFTQMQMLYNACQNITKPNVKVRFLSLGMSSDYQMAIVKGSNMVRIGSTIFGKRSVIQ